MMKVYEVSIDAASESTDDGDIEIWIATDLPLSAFKLKSDSRIRWVTETGVHPGHPGVDMVITTNK